MYKIVEKKELNIQTVYMKIYAPYVARKAKAGQFIIYRIDDKSERVPLTIADYDRENKTVSIIFQKVGYSTYKLAELNVGDEILDFVGPLGEASHFDGVKKACVIGGGLGVAIAYPQAKALSEQGCDVDVIVGFRNSELIILKDEFESASKNIEIVTDDGSYGRKGFVTTALTEKLSLGVNYDVVVAIGPLPMMKAVCDVTKPYEIKTIVSMNPIMIDGSGMCGGCRITVGGETKFACVDGPDFDGHLVDFNEAIKRTMTYKEKEQHMMQEHYCNLTGGNR